MTHEGTITVRCLCADAGRAAPASGVSTIPQPSCYSCSASTRLPERYLPIRPSGGLKQPVAIARAFAGDPRIVDCDEPTSVLDVSLLSAVPTLDDLDRLRIRLEGEIPSAAGPPSGCPFQTRCPRKIAQICETTEPELLEEEEEGGHGIRCHIPLEELRRLQAIPEDSSVEARTVES